MFVLTMIIWNVLVEKWGEFTPLKIKSIDKDTGENLSDKLSGSS